MNVFEHFNSKISIFDALDKLGIRYYGRVEQNIRCPSNDHYDRTPSAHIYEDGNMIKCFGCDKIFGVLSLYMEVEGYDLTQAIKAAAKDFNIPYEGVGFSTRKREKPWTMEDQFFKFVGYYRNDTIVIPYIDYVLEIFEYRVLGPAAWYVWATGVVSEGMKSSDDIDELKYECEREDDDGNDEDKWLCER